MSGVVCAFDSNNEIVDGCIGYGSLSDLVTKYPNDTAVELCDCVIPSSSEIHKYFVETVIVEDVNEYRLTLKTAANIQIAEDVIQTASDLLANKVEKDALLALNAGSESSVVQTMLAYLKANCS